MSLAEPWPVSPMFGGGRMAVSVIRALTRHFFYRGPDGELVYHPYGLFTRGYVVPDRETAARLARRQFVAILGTVPVTCAVLVALFSRIDVTAFPRILLHPAYLFGVLFAGTAANYGVLWGAHRGAVRGLRRTAGRLSWRTHAAQLADLHTPGALALGLACGALGVACGVVFAAVVFPAIGLLAILASAAGCLVTWYALSLQRQDEAYRNTAAPAGARDTRRDID